MIKMSVADKQDWDINDYVSFISVWVIKKYKLGPINRKDWRNKKFADKQLVETSIVRQTALFLRSYIMARENDLQLDKLEQLVADIALYLAPYTLNGMAPEYQNEYALGQVVDVWQEKIAYLIAQSSGGNIILSFYENSSCKKTDGGKNDAKVRSLREGQRWLNNAIRKNAIDEFETLDIDDIQAELAYVNDVVDKLRSESKAVKDSKKKYRHNNRERINKAWKEWESQHMRNLLYQKRVSSVVVAELGQKH